MEDLYNGPILYSTIYPNSKPTNADITLKLRIFSAFCQRKLLQTKTKNGNLFKIWPMNIAHGFKPATE